jgi:hypothetical protein
MLIMVDSINSNNLAKIISFEVDKVNQEVVVCSDIYSVTSQSAYHKYVVFSSNQMTNPFIFTPNLNHVLGL